ncbi:receptor-type tyrosine-protein phosphatase zeta-like isoform X1 [Magallana gigas]|uniref:receptor-type tyrosine-protein phosphatase zeta-like isoform X1 n=1 Tax=Magallana gigas TaxID=29159 RepID=UPI00333FE374
MLTDNVWIKALFIFTVIFFLKIEGTTAFPILEVSQTSTNGSSIASLGCDGDMDTFSLTNSGGIQSWSMILKTKTTITWIFISIGAGTYVIDILQNGAEPTSCASISQPVEGRMNTIITCPIIVNNVYDGVSISNEENKPLKIYEVEILGIVKLSKNQVLNFTDFPETVSRALDNDLETYYTSHGIKNASWFMKLDSVYLMKWFLISVRGGTFELHVTTGYTLTNSSTLCRAFHFSGIKKYQTALECVNAIRGDTIVVKKIDEGSLRLFELSPIICPLNHYGPNCAKCQEKCQSCDPFTGKCTQCQSSVYGENCNFSCPANCVDLICDHETGACNRCKNGFKGNHCEQDTTLLIVSTDAGNTTSLDKTNTTSLDKTTSSVPSNIKNLETTEDGNNVDPIILWCMLVILAILVAVVIILFVHSKKKVNPIEGKVEDNGIIIEFHRRISTYESDLVEIVEDDPNEIEEEVITVEYNNLTSQRVYKNKFIEDLPSRKNNGALEREFIDLPSGLLESYSNALKTFNRNRNRYKGIYPYDHNFVKLRADEDDTEGYVNASYIHGFGKEKAYIAAQGPFNQRTLEDFWGIVWQNDCTRIVMLTNLYEGDKMKCLKYWPDTELNIGSYTIELDGMDVFDSCTVRYLTVKFQEEVKKVTQFHFTAWPDNSVPEDVTLLISFRELVRSGLTSSDGPIVVHCSAGIGRTGTFIAIDYLLEEGAVEQTVDVKGYVISLRHQRGKSIQTYEQYVFLHDAVVEGFTNTNGQQSCLAVL